MNDETRVEDPAAAVMRLEGDLVSPALPAARSKLRDMVSAGIVHVTVDLSDTQMVELGGDRPVNLRAQFPEKGGRGVKRNPCFEGHSRSLPDDAHPSAFQRFRRLRSEWNYERSHP